MGKRKPKTKEELIKEITNLKKKISELEKLKKEQKKAEYSVDRLRKEVEDTTRNLQAIFDNTDVLLWVVRVDEDDELYYEQVNSAFAEVEGKTPDYYNGKKIADIATPEQYKAIKHSYEKIKGGKQYSYKVEFGRELEKRHFMVRLVPITDEEGKVTRFIGSAIDITIIQLADEALRESEERYRNIFENAPIGIYRTTPAGRIIMANPTLINMLGYSSFEDLTRRDPEKEGYEPPFAREQFIETIEKEGEIKGLESVWRKKDSSKIYIRENARAVKDEDGNTLYYEGTVEDITERKIAEKTQSVLHKIADVVNTATDLNELFASIHSYLSEIIDTTNFYIALYDKEKHILNFLYFIDEKDKFTSVPAEGTLTSYIIRNNIPLLATEKVVSELTEKGEIARKDIGTKAKVWLGVPLRTKEGIIGAVAVQSYTDPNLYTEKDLKLLDTVSYHIANAIENKIANEKILDSERTFRGIYNIILELVKEIDVHSVIKLVADHATKLMHAKDCAVYMIDHKEEVLFPVYSNDKEHQDEIMSFKIPLGKGLSGKVAETGKGAYINAGDKNDYSIHIPGTDIEDDKYESILSAPMFDEDKVIGVITISRVEKGFTDEDLEKLMVFARLAEITIKRAEHLEELRKSKERFQQVVENANEWVWEVDKDGLYTYSSPIVKSILGYKPEEIVGKKHFYDLFHPEEREELKKKAFDVFAKKSAFQGFINQNITKSGKKVWLATSGVPIIDKDGELLGYRGVDIDITEQLIAEQTLKESEEKYRKTLDSMGDAIHVVDEDLRIVLFNKAFKRFNKKMGLPTNVIGKEIFEVFPFLPDTVRDEYKEVFKTGKTLITEETNIIGNREITTETRKIPIFTGSKISQIVTVIRDITERKKAEDALRKSEEKYRSLADNIPVGIFRSTPDGHIISGNPSIARMYGYDSPEDAQDVNISDFYLTSEDRNKFIDTVSSKGAISNYEVQQRRRDGTVFWCSISARAIKNEKGDVVLFDGVMEDITNRKLMEEALIRSEEFNRAIIENSPLGISVRDRNTALLSVNDAWRRMWGFSEEEVNNFLGEKIKLDYEAESMEHLKDHITEIKKVFKSGGDLHIPELKVNKPKPGTAEWISMHLYAIKDAKGEVDRVVTITEDITERKNAEKAIRESEERYRTLHENVPVGLFRSTPDPWGRHLSANPALARMFGYDSPEDMYDVRIADLYLNPKDRKKFLETVISKGEISNYEVRFRRRDGSIFWGSLSASAIRDEDGNITYLDGILEDITERKTSEQVRAVIYRIADAVNTTKDLDELFKSIQKHLETIMDTSNFYIALYDRETDTFSIPYHIDNKDKFTTFPAGKSLTKYVINNDRPLLVRNKDIEEMTRKGLIERVGTPSKVWMGVPLKVGDKIIGAVAVQSYTDETLYSENDLEIFKFVSDQIALAIEKKMAEEALVESEEKYRTLVEQATDGVIIVQDGVFKFVNTATAKLLGLDTPDELIGKQFIDFITPEFREKVVERHRITMAGKGTPSIYEIAITDVVGHTIPIELNVGIIKYNERPAAIILVRDISERKKAEEELKKAFTELEHAHRELKKLDTAKTEFLNITSHELRSPLTSILGYAEILSEGLVGPVTDGQRESAYGILRNARQLERLINDLLDFTQMETGRLRLDTEVCDLKPIIKDAVESMRPRIEEAGCAVSIEVPPDLPPSICDARRITQVLYNLIGNAVKFSPDGGTITISANKVDRFIRISVKDEGVGIPEENQEKIFDKFYQVDMSDTRRARGLGLGLAISKAIIDAHGGSIWVDSKPEKGSTFYFTVPIEERRRS